MQQYVFFILKNSLLVFFFFSTHAAASEAIKLQLKWQHQFQFSGYYAAKEKGFYADEGLNVEILEGGSDIDPASDVLHGKAEYGVGNSSLLLLRHSGKPLVVLAVIFQHSPFVLLTRQYSSTQSIHDLVNKSLMIEPLSDELIAYLKHEGMSLKNFEFVEYSHDIEKFISGQVDAISAYVTDEPYILNKKSIPFYLFSPRSAGIDFYGDNLFTTEKELHEYPDRVRKFRRASMRGWQYAMNHQEEISDLIIRKYSTKKSREALLYEAGKMQQLMHPEIIDIGYMLPGRWRHIAETYAELGMLPADVPLDGFLFREKSSEDYVWLYILVASVLSVLMIVLVVALRFRKLNKDLLRLLYIKSQFENIGESVNSISHQWKQPLNELGIQLMLIESTVRGSSSSSSEKESVARVTENSHGILEFMAATVDVFGNLTKGGNKQTCIHPKTIIEDLAQLIGAGFEIHSISITSELDDDIYLNGSSAELSHAILSIMNNARDAFIERGIVSPNIHIHLYKSDKHIYIDISDNAGGIRVKPISRIFKLGSSDKKANGSGVGLYITKQLIENSFYGKVYAENTDSGSTFKIELPLL